MHELGLARNIAAIIKEHAKGRTIKEVRVAIGPLACVEKQALAFCWGLVTEKSEIEKCQPWLCRRRGRHVCRS